MDDSPILPKENNQLPKIGKITQTIENITFSILTNHTDDIETKILLLQAKNLFAGRLASMDKEYIMRLVFDRYHQTLVVMDESNAIIGGVCYRQFKDRRFTEIAFLAVTPSKQIKGFGTKIMNKLKNQMQKRQIEYLITCADCTAVGFFKKQGFSDDCDQIKEVYEGYLKEYAKVTLMYCSIHPSIDYQRIKEIIQTQKQYLRKKIIESQIEFGPFDCKVLQKIRKDQNSKFTKTIKIDRDYKVREFPFDPTRIPGLMESGWTFEEYEELMNEEPIERDFQYQQIVDQLRKHPTSKLITQAEPQLKNKLNNLSTLQTQIISGKYRCNCQLFEKDVLELLKCWKRAYLQENKSAYQSLCDLQAYIIPHLNALKVKINEKIDKNKLQSKQAENEVILPERTRKSRKKLQKK